MNAFRQRLRWTSIKRIRIGHRRERGTKRKGAMEEKKDQLTPSCDVFLLMLIVDGESDSVASLEVLPVEVGS